MDSERQLLWANALSMCYTISKSEKLNTGCQRIFLPLASGEPLEERGTLMHPAIAAQKVGC